MKISDFLLEIIDEHGEVLILEFPVLISPGIL